VELPDDHPEIAEFHESARRTLARAMRESGKQATQDIPFIASRLKLKRADDHADELKSAISDYLSRIPVREIRSQHPADARYMKWELVCVERAPVYLGAILGDAVHNLRAALDLLAVDLVLLNRKSEKGVHFPFAASAAELERQIKDKNMDRASPEVVNLIRALKPYVGGNLALRYVHDLDLMDKHQMVLPVVVAAHGASSIVRLDYRALAPGVLGGGMHQTYPGIAAAPAGTYHASVTLSFPVDGPFGSDDPFTPAPDVAQALHRLAEECSGIVDACELLCFGTATKQFPWP
jgi:hypothetical protein